MKKTLVLLALLASCSERPAPPAPPAPPPAPVAPAPSGPEKIKVVSKEAPFTPADYLVSGYVTILDFTADW